MSSQAELYNKYEWLWKTLKGHKQSLIDKFEIRGKPVPLQHKSTLDVMNYLEIREQAVNGNNAFAANDRIIVEAARKAGILIEESTIEHECPKCGADLDFYGGMATCPDDGCSYQVPADLDDD